MTSLNGSGKKSFSLASEALNRVGREGRLDLVFGLEGSKTVLKDSYAVMPMHALPPFHLDESGWAYAYTVNPTAGLVEGDHLDVEITLEPGAQVCLTAPAATKVYKSSGACAEQITRIRVREGAGLLFYPRFVIPFAESRYCQKTRIELEPSATLFFAEAFTIGRPSRKERLAFSEFQSSLEILSQGQTLAADRSILEPARTDYDATGYLESFNACLSIYILPTHSASLAQLHQEMAKLLDPMKDILSGITRLPFRGLMVRLLGKTVFELEEALIKIMAVFQERPSPSLPALKRLIL